MMDNQELKDFIGLAMTDLRRDISRLADSLEKQNILIREIDIKTTTRVAELQKDVDDIRRDVSDNKAEIKSLGDSQKFKWKTASEQREADKAEESKKWELQAVINEGNKQVRTILYAIFLLVLSLVGGFVWQMIVNGGVRGVTVP